MIDASKLHPITRDALIAAGWFPERRVATVAWQRLLTDDGYTWTDIAQRFLSNLGGLTIRPIKTVESLFGSEPFIIDPEYVAGEYVRIHEREVLLGEALCALGEWGGDGMVLCTPSGHVYSETPYQVLLLSHTLENSLDVIVRAHRYPELIHGTVWWASNHRTPEAP